MAKSGRIGPQGGKKGASKATKIRAVKVKLRKNETLKKPKFKVGKPLPKGLNVTDTSFRAQKILLSTQLAEKSGITSKNKLTIKVTDVETALGNIKC